MLYEKSINKNNKIFEEAYDYPLLSIVNSIRKKRSCLMCGKIFDSKGVFNRRCLKCKKSKKADPFEPTVYKFTDTE